MPRLLSRAASVLSCRVFTPTRAASTPLPLAYPGCINVPTSARHVGCLGVKPAAGRRATSDFSCDLIDKRTEGPLWGAS